MFDEGFVFNIKDTYISIMKVKHPILTRGKGLFSKNILKWPENIRNKDVPHYWPSGKCKSKLQRSSLENSTWVDVCYHFQILYSLYVSPSSIPYSLPFSSCLNLLKTLCLCFKTKQHCKEFLDHVTWCAYSEKGNTRDKQDQAIQKDSFPECELWNDSSL